ncbi:MAG: DUF5715 family protein [Candidatus Palauibacterales bacterium]|nr:DUF5715 family protein [Candidatus Palauibacterales bacterium]
MRVDTARSSRVIRLATGVFIGLGWAVTPVNPLGAQSLRGSKSSLDLQNRVAAEHDYTFIRTADQVRWFVEKGYLVRLRSGPGYELKRMSYPYARPEVELFVSRLGTQYLAACGEKLVVTSLTRPTTRQPRNASSRSVHPTGMAMDLRRSSNRTCRSWLESVLLRLEGAGVLEATYERHPPHFHVALFPKPYAAYVERKVASGDTAGELEYRVRRGDSLWSIAHRHGIDVTSLRTANDLDGSRIYAGQVLTVPLGR